jgi:hypothetical protein
MKVKDLFAGVWSAAPLKLRSLYDPKALDSALKGKVSAQTVTVKNGQTGEIVGKRTIYQK